MTRSQDGDRRVLRAGAPAPEPGAASGVRTRLRRAVPVLVVQDVVAATRAYADALGLDVLMDHGWIATLGSAGGAQLSVMKKDLTAACDPELSLEVDDVDAARLGVGAAGLEILHELTDEAWGVRRFLFRDPDGHVVNVLSHLEA